MKTTQQNKKTMTSEKACWRHMLDRCNNINHKSYSSYGGRGIKVCERWTESFENFIEDMGVKPGKEYSIDRIDNNKGYFPENCRWATRSEQCFNRRPYGSIPYRGVFQENRKGNKLFKALISIKNLGLKHIGYYKTAEEAAQAYNQYIIENFLPNQLNVL